MGETANLGCPRVEAQITTAAESGKTKIPGKTAISRGGYAKTIPTAISRGSKTATIAPAIRRGPAAALTATTTGGSPTTIETGAGKT